MCRRVIDLKIPYDITFHPGWWHKHAGVSFAKDFFYNCDYRIEADMAMRKVLFEKFGDYGIGEKDPLPRPILGSDLIASGFLHSEIMGCEVRYSDMNPPEVICAKLDDDAAEGVMAVDLSRSETWSRIEDQIKYLQGKYGHVDSCLNLMGVQNIVLDLRGSELFIDYHVNGELAHKLLEACTLTSIDIGRRLKKVSEHVSAGVTAIVSKTTPDVYLTSNCTVEMVSLKNYEDFLLKYDNMLAEEFGDFGIHHCGKTMEHIVEGYAKVKNLKFAEAGAFSDIGFVRKHLPGVHLNARYSPVRLKEAGYTEIGEEVAKLLRVGKPNELLSISCVGIDSDTPDEKVRDFLKACVEVQKLA